MSLADIGTVLLRRWKVIVFCVVLGALAGYALGARIPTRYSATTSLVVSPLVTNPFTNTREEVNIRTEREILGSREVAARASELLGESFESSSYLLSHVDVAAPSGSQILQVAVQATSPEDAAAAADALSQAYLEFRSEGADAVAQRYLDSIDEQLADLASEPDTVANEALETTLQQQRATVLLSTSEPGRIIGAAVVPTAPSTPSDNILIVAGTVFGLMIGCALALVRERTDRHVGTIDRLESAVDVPIIEAWSLADDEAWEEVAQALERTIGTNRDHNPRILIDGLGWAKDSALGEDVENRLSAVLSFDAESHADPDSRRFRWDSIVSEPKYSFADVTAERSRARVMRVARICDVALHIVSPKATLDEVRDALTRMEAVGADPVVVFVRDGREPPRDDAA
jgi:capsular polysaccharide biosynthesis protein